MGMTPRETILCKLELVQLQLVEVAAAIKTIENFVDRMGDENYPPH